MRMAQIGEQQGFAFEAGGCLRDLLGAETFLLHLFESDEAIAKTGICCPIDGAKTALAYLFEDAITIVEHHIFGPLKEKTTYVILFCLFRDVEDQMIYKLRVIKRPIHPGIAYDAQL